MWRVWGRGELCTGFWWGSLRDGDHWGDPDVDGSSGSGRGVGAERSGLRIGTVGGHL
jgi:hypothetical protein